MKNKPIKLLNLNIHADFHLKNVTDLVDTYTPDVICFQEAEKPFVLELAKRIGYEYQFSLRTYNEPRDDSQTPIEEGIMIAWHPSLTLTEVHVHEYNGKNAHYPENDSNDVRRTLLVVTLRKGEDIFRIATTHFTWTPDGSASDEQRRDMHHMLNALNSYHDSHGIIFCGDFNAPRGGEIFAMMSEKYTDNLPPHIVTTLDQRLHRAAPIFHAVDTIFSTKEYSVFNVEVIDGVSDHMALFALVSKSVC